MKPLLEKFKSREPPKRRVAKLEKIKNEVIDLYQSGYSVEQIHEFAKLEKIEVSISSVKRFLSKLKASNFSFSTNPSAKPTSVKNERKPSSFIEKIIKQAQE